MSLMDERPAAGCRHTIVADASLTAIEAWDELTTFGQRLTFTGGVDREVIVDGCDGEMCLNIGGENLVTT